RLPLALGKRLFLELQLGECRGGFRFGFGRGLLRLLALSRVLLRRFIRLAGDTSFQVAKALAMPGDPLANLLTLLLNGLRKRLAPRIGGGRLAKRFFHVDNPRRGTRRGPQAGNLPAESPTVPIGRGEGTVKGGGG